MNRYTFRMLTRSIRATLGRYLAILGIVTLGIGFFAGLKSSYPAMRSTAERYLSQQHFHDFRLLSTLGFTEDDLRAFAALDGVAAAEGTYFTDALARADGKQEAYHLMSLTQGVDLPVLTEGRMPEKANECLADVKAFDAKDLGKTVTLTEENDEDTLKLLRERSYTIVGLVKSPRYISESRGDTTLGSGRIKAFLLLPAEAFDSEAYHELLLWCDLPGQLYSDEYDAARQRMETRVKELQNRRGALRYQELRAEADRELADARKEIDDGWEDYREGKAEADDKLADALKELNYAESKLVKGQKEIDDGREKLADGIKKVEDGRKELKKNRKTLKEKEKELAEGRAELEKAEKELAGGEEKLEQGKAELKEKKDAALGQLEDGIAKLESGIKTIEEQIAALSDAPTIEELNEQLTSLQAALTEAKGALETLQTQADEQGPALDARITQLKGEIRDLQAGIDSAQSELDGIEGDGPEEEQRREELRAQIARDQEALRTLQGQAEEAAAQKAELDAAVASCSQQVETLEAAVGTLQEQIDQLSKAPSIEELNTLLAQQKATLKETKQKLKEVKEQFAEAEAELKKQEDTLAESRKKLEASKEKLEKGEKSLKEGKEKLDAAEEELDAAEKEFPNSRKKLDDAQKEIDKGLAEWADGKEDYEQAKSDAEQELKDALQELQDGEREYRDAAAEAEDRLKLDLYCLDRDSNQGYLTFGNDILIVDGLANAFPVFFALVAALVCVTTMTRMVNEERTLIGTMKAMGYGSGAAMSKYLLYSGSSALLGAVSGFFLGTAAIPYIFWVAYGIIYDYAKLDFYFSPLMYGCSLAAAVLGTLLVTWLACRRELRSKPAELMRPKAPKAGRRILLERIGPIWRRLPFLSKVSLRNAFRYPLRVMMMLLGIGGCTALLVAGFGARDSIARISEYQYGEIFLYDMAVSLDTEEFSSDEKAAVLWDRDAQQWAMTWQEPVTLSFGGKEKSTRAVAAEEGALEGLISLHDADGELPFPGPGEAVITEKIAESLSLSAGDRFTLKTDDGETVELTVSGVCKNYLRHYVFLNTAGLGSPRHNTALLRAGEDVDVSRLGARLRAEDGVSYVSLTAQERELMEQSMASLDLLVLLLILCSGALAFITLYNLTNINIMERLREIATVKVLGFYPKETGAYVLNENLLLSLLGAALGLVLGKLLHYVVIRAIVVDNMSYEIRIAPLSYLLALGITMVFTLLTNSLMRGKLEKVRMAESLKAVE